MLEWAGYISEAGAAGADGVIVQPESALMAIRVMTSLVPIIFLVLSLIMVLRYPINVQRLKEIQDQLAINRQKKQEAF